MGERRAGAAARRGTSFSGLLGRLLGAYALDAVCRLDPEAVLVLAGLGAAGRDRWEGLIRGVDTKTPVFLLRGKGRRNALAALAAAGDVFEKYPDRDVLVVPASLPLLRPQTLKSLLRAHGNIWTLCCEVYGKDDHEDNDTS